MIDLGVTVKDKVTGFSGVVTGVVYYITGCNQALVVPKVGKDGSQREAQWFDWQRLDIDRKAKRVVLDNGATPGFDKAAPKR